MLEQQDIVEKKTRQAWKLNTTYANEPRESWACKLNLQVAFEQMYSN